MKKALLMTLQACLLAGVASTALAADKLVFGIALEPYPPFSFKSGKGDWSGFEPEMITAVCAQMKAECTLNEMSWDGLIPALKSQQVDVVLNSLSITPERQQVIDFTQPYFFTRALWIGDRSMELVPTPAGLKGKIIGVQGSTTHSAFVKKYYGDSTIRYYNDQDDILADLRSGRVDIMLADQLVVEPLLDKPDNSMLAGKGLAPIDPLFGDGVGAGVRKGSDALRERLNVALQAMRDDGTYEKIRARYFKSDITVLE
ncbi:amino acid ABC transporter substrate-binding protein, PAAT family [Pseudomonas sp. ok272]|uniref:transporter substrate-binding domain-containing protein n=1 Tax=unclassified Pseudomonas TaxID=196821 RepID=UPI0008D67245|nr:MULTISPECIES: transporter substrate-binding domain-containing protein [unclassified Pseudomonas]SEM38902.1 amino acid ABC transporter substrate-binding protein, PAAT family [Pseudomonas sp. ok272]SFM39763.1 amino acid ABC transporter substrate-binding protein, PAAT family [Pseudomonas sp. ok602]